MLISIFKKFLLSLLLLLLLLWADSSVSFGGDGGLVAKL